MITQKPLNLHSPSPDALTHSAELARYIQAEIDRLRGSISFREFMQLALYAPGLGYYSVGLQKLGKQGDFVTAPEITPLFSYCLARQYQDIIKTIPYSTILEIGAGTGRMAADGLSYLKSHSCLPDSYFILEVSADLRERQKKLLKHEHADYFSHIHWLDSLPENFEGIIVANEVLDAMPVSLFHYDHSLQEYYVEYKDSEFQFLLKPPSQELRVAFQTLNPATWQRPYTSEINLLLPHWIKSIAHSLNQGVVLLIDYGFPRHEYYHPQRNMGTLMCHYQHHAHTNPLILVGLQDITAHVDFTAVAEAATHVGLTLEGFVTQAHFLLNCGLEKLVSDSLSLNEKTAIQQLTHPAEMGELFKVMGFSKGIEIPLRGFSDYDISEKL